MRETKSDLPESWGDYPPNLEIIPGIVLIDNVATPLNPDRPETVERVRDKAVEFLIRPDNDGILAKVKEGKHIFAFVSGHGKALLIAAGATAVAATGMAVTVAVALHRRNEEPDNKKKIIKPR